MKLSQSGKTGAKTLKRAVEILTEAGGSMRTAELIEEIERTTEFTPWEKERYEKTGGVRWHSIFLFNTIGLAKGGLLRKTRGTISITPEGERLVNLSPEELRQLTKSEYKKWKDARDDAVPDANDDPDTIDGSQLLLIEEIESKAVDGLRNHISKLNPYEFQDTVAALLRAMGYHTPFVAPKGKDGGVDIIAYQDPLGTKVPRIKVQVKHRPESKVSSPEVQQLMGTLNPNTEIGIFVSSGGFSTDAQRLVQQSPNHIEMIDFERFRQLWQDHYSKMPDEDKDFLPLRPIYFLAE